MTPPIRSLPRAAVQTGLVLWAFLAVSTISFAVAAKARQEKQGLWKNERAVPPWLRRAGNDPFWRVRTRRKLVWPAFAAGVALLLAVSACWNVLSGDLPGAAPEVIPPAGTELPALTPAPEMRPSEEAVAQFNEGYAQFNKEGAQFNEERAPFKSDARGTLKPVPGCELPPVRLHGVVAGRIFSASIAGASPSWYSLGDTLGPFEVVSIGKDRVQLACGGETREVRNGM